VKCQACGAKPATVHLTDIVAGQKKERHLCEGCAEGQHLLQGKGLNLSALLQALLSQHVGPQAGELARLACPACGIRFMEFRAQGRLGCPHDYTVFRAGLEPLLRRIHRSVRHAGKSPRRGAAGGPDAELLGLRRRLRAAVDAEAFEEAARIRDLLRKREAGDEPG
jgi:protein arginine kinase activator